MRFWRTTLRWTRRATGEERCARIRTLKLVASRAGGAAGRAVTTMPSQLEARAMRSRFAARGGSRPTSRASSGRRASGGSRSRRSTCCRSSWRRSSPRGPRRSASRSACSRSRPVVATPFAGWVVDRFPRRYAIAAGSALMAIAAAGFVGVRRLGPVLDGLRLLQGLSYALVVTAVGTLVADVVPRERLNQALGLLGREHADHERGGAGGRRAAGDRRRRHAGVRARRAAPRVVSTLLALQVHESTWQPPAVATVPASALARAADRTALRSRHRAERRDLRRRVHLRADGYALALGRGRVGSFFVAYGCAAIIVRLVFGGVPARIGSYRVARGRARALRGGGVRVWRSRVRRRSSRSGRSSASRTDSSIRRERDGGDRGSPARARSDDRDLHGRLRDSASPSARPLLGHVAASGRLPVGLRRRECRDDRRAPRFSSGSPPLRAAGRASTRCARRWARRGLRTRARAVPGTSSALRARRGR